MTSDSLITGEATQDAASGQDQTQQTEGKVNEGANDSQVESTDQAQEDEPYLFAGKYKTTDELEKGYKELTKKIGERFPTAPDEYEFDFSQDTDFGDKAEIIDSSLKESPFLEAVLPAMKKHNVSQDAAIDMVKAYLQAEMAQVPDGTEELAKLGSDGNQILQDVNNFVSKFSEVEQQLFQQIGGTAEGVKLVHKMSQLGGEKNIPTEAQAEARLDYNDLIKEASELKKMPNFEANSNLVAKYEKIMDQAMIMKMSK